MISDVGFPACRPTQAVTMLVQRQRASSMRALFASKALPSLVGSLFEATLRHGV